MVWIDNAQTANQTKGCEKTVPDQTAPTQSAQSGVDPRLLVAIIPARNEQLTVGNIVRQVKREAGCDVVVVDDASTDQTGEQAREAGAIVLPLRFQLNAWGATQAGLRYALKSGYRLAVTLDSDGQHLAESIHSLLPALLEDRADVVIGAFPQRGSRARRMAWSFFRMISGLSFEDLTSGLRGYNHRAMKALASRQATILDYQDLGVLLLLRRSGFRILEVPVVMKERVLGKSKIFDSWFTVFRYMVQTMLLCLSKIDVKRPPPE